MSVKNINRRFRFLSSKKLSYLPLSSLAPIIIVPTFMIIASFGYIYSAIVFLLLPLLVSHFYIFSVSRQSGNKFFFMWNLVSLFYIFMCLEFLVVPLMLVSPWENVTFYFLLVLVLLYFRKIKRNAIQFIMNDLKEGTSSLFSKEHYCSVCSHKVSNKYVHCSICHACIYDRSHHSVWVNCCISRINRKEFIIMLYCLVLWLLFTSYLIFTTVCSSTLQYNSILLPTDCSSVYSDYRSSLSFVGALYCLEISFFAIVSLIRETTYLWKI